MVAEVIFVEYLFIKKLTNFKNNLIAKNLYRVAPRLFLI